MLFYSGTKGYIGDVDDGNTEMDFLPEERDRGITIASAATTFGWNEHTFNLIDTPGHVDFTIEVERALRVLDGAVTVLDAVAGVEAQTVTVWRQADKFNIPRLVFVNKMDREGADFARSVSMLKSKLNVVPAVVQVPIGSAGEFNGVLDLIRCQHVSWDQADEGKTMVVSEVTEGSEHWDTLIEHREQLVDVLADHNLDLAEVVFLRANTNTASYRDHRQP